MVSIASLYPAGALQVLDYSSGTYLNGQPWAPWQMIPKICRQQRCRSPSCRHLNLYLQVCSQLSNRNRLLIVPIEIIRKILHTIHDVSTLSNFTHCSPTIRGIYLHERQRIFTRVVLNELHDKNIIDLLNPPQLLEVRLKPLANPATESITYQATYKSLYHQLTSTSKGPILLSFDECRQLRRTIDVVTWRLDKEEGSHTSPHCPNWPNDNSSYWYIDKDGRNSYVTVYVGVVLDDVEDELDELSKVVMNHHYCYEHTQWEDRQQREWDPAKTRLIESLFDQGALL